ncbi:hypothetical protein MTO96_010444 [Rhipicephalus appendiculatus]
MCRVVAVSCDGEEEDDLVRGVAREGESEKIGQGTGHEAGPSLAAVCRRAYSGFGPRARGGRLRLPEAVPVAEFLVQRPRLHAPATPTELRHRTLDAFDPATSSATPNRTTMFDFRA